MLLITAGIAYFTYNHCKERRQKALELKIEEDEIQDAIAPGTKTNHRYLPNSKDTEISDENSLLGTPKGAP